MARGHYAQIFPEGWSQRGGMKWVVGEGSTEEREPQASVENSGLEIRNTFVRVACSGESFCYFLPEQLLNIKYSSEFLLEFSFFFLLFIHMET